MVDVVDKATRSRMMYGIRSSNTKPEVLTRKALHKLGYRFRLDSKVGKIKPDIVLRKYKVAVFTHGCYWHQHEGCKLAYSDRHYSGKWKNKFSDNQDRDQRVEQQLKDEGWRVAVVWECATRDTAIFKEILILLNSWIKNDKSQYFESQYKKE
ncbi:MAG: DNA mismatch endonuclease Vsr [Gammaproteobacteria bacterium]|nr:DNA mismatch endonuclease Vsr [Candidatus Brocadiales bacterium]MBL7005284.1 DNA mismatch endonuclease Vsr [Gammaproteobacteria bacterium]